MSKRFFQLIVILGLTLLISSPRTQADNVYVLDSSADAVFQVDLSTGNRTVISDDTTPDAVNIFGNPLDGVLESDGNILLVDAGLDAIIRVNVTTGARTVVSSSSVGSGPNFSDPRGIALLTGGTTAVVTDAGLDAVVSVDLSNGNRTILSDGSNPNATNPITTPRDIVIEADGNYLVTDTTADVIVRVDKDTGARTIVSSSAVGTGTPSFNTPNGIALESGGTTAIVVDSGSTTGDAVFRVTLSNGNRTILSSDTIPNATNELNGPEDVIIESDGNILISDNSSTTDFIVRVNKTTGVRTIVSSSTVGTGTSSFAAPVGIILIATTSSTPTITSSTYNFTTGVLVVTGTNFEAKSGDANDVTAAKFTLTGDSSATYTLTDTADVEIDSATQFTLTLSATDKLAANGLFNKDGTSSDGSTTYNLAAADDFIANVTTGTTSDTTATVTVSNYATPAVTSATYDFSTGALVVTGTGFVSKSGSANDVDISTLTFTGDGGTTYQVTSTTDVEITSATAFTVTLSGADQLAVNGLLNKNGTQADDGSTTYNLAAADNWMVAAATSTDIADTTSNGITVSNYAIPTITSATYDYSSGAMVVTGTGFVSKSGDANDVDISTLTFTGDSGATYAVTSTTDVEITSATAFTVTLSSADLFAVRGLLNKDGTASDGNTTYNLAAADNWMAAAATSTDIADATGNGITVSNYATPAVTSATYDASTGALVVTGTGFVSKSDSANDVDVSTFTFTGDGNASYTATSTTDIEITSDTAFTITLSGTDILNVNGLLNKNGTTSDDNTIYNLAAADNWMVAAATSTDIADTSSNGITVSNVSDPAITSATYSTSSGALVVTGTNFVSENGSTNDVDPTTMTITGEADGTRTLTTSAVEVTSATEFTVTLNSADKTAVDALLNKAGTASEDNTTYNLAAADNWMAGAAAISNIADATTAITVGTITAPTITSATYDASSGALVVTGTDFVSKSGTGTDVDSTKITLTGDSGGTYTLTSSAVDITSATAFTITLNSADKRNVNGLLNKDGTTSDSGTTYNLAAAEDWMAGTAAATDVADLTSNAITVSNVTAPVITSVAYDASTGALVATGTNFVNESGATNDVDPTKLTVTGESGGTYVLTASSVEITSATEFTITLSGTDKLSVNSLLNKNGATSDSGTTYNLAAADNWMAGAATATDIADATTAITASNVTAPAITSATYDVSTGALVVTGTNFINESGSNNDVDPTKLTITGDSSATYILTSTSVDITSATAFTITVNSTDKINLNGLLNKDGTSSDSGTDYNLAAADNWMAGSEAATDIGDLTSNAITVSNVAVPAISSATYDASTGSLVITGTNLVKESGTDNDVDLTKFSLKGEGSKSYTLTTTSVETSSATTFTVTLNSTDIINVNGLLNKNGTTSDDSVTYNLDAADNWMPGAAANTDIADATSAITVSNVTAPVITSATYDASSGALVVTGTNFVKLSGDTNDIDPAQFTLKGDSDGTYVLTTTSVETSSATTFTVTLSATDIINVNGLLNKDGTTSDSGTTYNLAAADNWMAGAAATTDIADGTNNSITVSNVTAPTITSATYNASTGVLVATGTNFVKEVGTTNDVDPTKLTITGESSGTYVLTASAVEISSATEFTITLSGTDKYNVNGLLNKNGTTSDGNTTYNIAAADDWMPGAAASTDIANATSAITVSGVTAPAITSATYNATTGVLVTTGTDFVSKSGSANDVDPTKLTLKGQASGTHLLTSSSGEITSATEFSITLNSTDKLNVNGLLNKAGTASEDNVTYNLAAADDWMAGAASSTDIADATNGITVSNVPVPAITSATYDASTGILVATGTDFVGASGDTNDVDPTKLILKGEGAGTRTLTTSAVEITSATSFSITLNTSDKSAVDALLNKDGTSSLDNTVYNLAASEDWLAGAAASATIADSTTGITVSGVAAPTITSAAYDASTGDLVVTGADFRSASGDANDVDVSKFTVTGDGGGGLYFNQHNGF